MKTYINIAEEWGFTVECSAKDYGEQAEMFGIEKPDVIEEEDGLYIKGIKVAVPVEEYYERL